MVAIPSLCTCKMGVRGKRLCPIHLPLRILPKIKVKEEFFGESSTVFVGRSGYPDIQIGPMGSIDAIQNSSKLFSMNYEDIVEHFFLQLRSRYKENIFSKSAFINETQDLALATKPTDVEMKFTRKPIFNVKYSAIIQPMGPSAKLRKLKIVSNPKIPKKVDRIVTDDLKAEDQIFALYGEKIDNFQISAILSSGILGRKKKLVPTRWSITASDDIVAKKLINEIKYCDTINEFQVYESERFGNHFVILLIPGAWEFENFEAWAPLSSWARTMKETQIIEEWEPHQGRKDYATEQRGGYYAARLGIVEFLSKIRKQARVISFREINEEYSIPVGVWQVREGVRNAFTKQHVKFINLKEALNYIKSKLNIPLDVYKNQSKILKQSRLGDYL